MSGDSWDPGQEMLPGPVVWTCPGVLFPHTARRLCRRSMSCLGGCQTPSTELQRNREGLWLTLIYFPLSSQEPLPSSYHGADQGREGMWGPCRCDNTVCATTMCGQQKGVRAGAHSFLSLHQRRARVSTHSEAVSQHCTLKAQEHTSSRDPACQAQGLGLPRDLGCQAQEP